jgi:hypothetical protein
MHLHYYSLVVALVALKEINYYSVVLVLYVCTTRSIESYDKECGTR